MSKGSYLAGQPIFTQILSYLQRGAVQRIAQESKADHYCKYFDTYNHLVSMLYAIFNKCQSLREVTTGLAAWEGRLQHLGISETPKRSTFSDANSRRPEGVFGNIYEHVLEEYKRLLPDSQSDSLNKSLYIVDSTTVSLFSDVMKNAGRNPANGRRKGGMKVHTLIQSTQDVPCLIKMTAAAKQDSPFLKDIELPKGSILVFDKGYNDYEQFNQFSSKDVNWVTRLRTNAVYEINKELAVDDCDSRAGVLKDSLVTLGHSNSKHFVKARIVEFNASQAKRKFQFLTNNTELPSSTIAALYKKRWQIETWFKRFKQNYPLTYFLGQSENAIKIQVWCSMIADLLIKIVKLIAGKKWSFSNLTSFIRIHLMTYIGLYDFLANPEKALRRQSQQISIQNNLFPT
jgi:hypothetical protein